MQNKKIFLIIILSVLLILTACHQPQATQPVETAEQKPVEKIVLGAMFPLSGDAAAHGEPISRQMLLAVDEINAAGGIDGKQIEIKLEDSKCDPKEGAIAAQKLIEVDKVKVIFGGACSGETLGAAPIAEQNQVLLISPSATSPDITKTGDYVFRTAPSDTYAGKVAAEKALSMNFSRPAIIYETTDYAQGLKKVFERVIGDAGRKIAIVESFSSEDNDFKTQLLKIKNVNPDVIYAVPQTPAKGVLLVKQIKEQGLKQQLLTGELLIGLSLVKENAKDFEGIIGVEAFFDANGEKAKQALEAYKTKYGEPPWPFYQVAMRDAVYLVADAIKKHGLDTAKLKQELYSTKDWEGAVGKLTIDENGDPVLGYSVKQVTEGEVIEIGRA